MAYVRGKVVAVIRLNSPLPLILHVRLGYGLDPGFDLSFVQPAAAEGPQEIVSGKNLGVVEILDNLIDCIKLDHHLLRAVSPFELLVGRGKMK